eukprot:TRINITY_DN136740_c0_g1_i1.p1 TRINITY_DN136740_c0_g1~~TRINITY_DN136740_c0_g1_i1.p1  ORF type:complete len:165 (-),score=61.98 TRINITY_DN136740_c0_g1_i1:54-491(-)
MSTARGITVKDVPADAFIKAYAKYLKRSGRVELPKWVDIVKTGVGKQLAPLDPDWYYTRMASMARKVYLYGPIGVGKFTKIYGGSMKQGYRPSHFTRASGSVARSVLHQLENLKVVEKDNKGGRKVTHTGQRDLDRIAGQLLQKK